MLTRAPNAARLWMESSPDQKQRLKLIFQQGVSFAAGTYRTTATNMIFFELEEIAVKGKCGSANGNRTRVLRMRISRPNP